MTLFGPIFTPENPSGFDIFREKGVENAFFCCFFEKNQSLCQDEISSLETPWIFLVPQGSGFGRSQNTEIIEIIKIIIFNEIIKIIKIIDLMF